MNKGINPGMLPDMYWILHMYGVWCRGKKAPCYKGNLLACRTCKFYNRKGVSNYNRPDEKR